MYIYNLAMVSRFYNYTHTSSENMHDSAGLLVDQIFSEQAIVRPKNIRWSKIF